MYEIQCFDPYGNTINNLTQWDIDQSLVIPIDSLNMPNIHIRSSEEVDEYDPPARYDTPEVHFSNKSREEALVVSSNKFGDNAIMVSVPNILLQEAHPLQVYVYVTDLNDISSQKTILHNEIPIRKRQKPSDYLYIENISRVTAEMIKDEIELVVNNTRQKAIDDITEKKEESVNLVEAAKTTAINNIETTTSNAEKEVNNQMDEDYNEGSITVNGVTYTGGFVNVGNDIISELDNIKENSLYEYNETVSIADSTQEQIENDIDKAINEDGLALKSIHDDAGNVDIVILINQQSAS